MAERVNRRELKKKVRAALVSGDFEAARAKLNEEEPLALKGLLIAAITGRQGEEQRRAVTALGDAAERLAQEDVEEVREIMRRFIWSLTEESGAIGWGAPGAMVEIMIRIETLTREYTPVLLSYIHKGPNWLDHPPLRLEAIAAIRRLAEARPEALRAAEADDLLKNYLDDEDPVARQEARQALEALGVSS